MFSVILIMFNHLFMVHRQETTVFPQNIQQLRETLFLETQEDSEDEYEEDYEENCGEPIYATLSSRSACSATTAANDDFEFYQQEGLRGNSNKQQHGSPRNPSVRRRASRSSSIDRILTRQEVSQLVVDKASC